MSEATFTRWVDPTIEEKDKEIERLTNELNQCMIDHNKLLDRIDKAIEYIEQHNDYFLLKREVKKVLDILKGVDK